ncbi:MAG: hypothetical protein AAFP18_13300 [Bacteroidota bacterium]
MAAIEEHVEQGLEQIAPERTVEIPLRDALYAYKVIGEFIRFFHQPSHYPTLEDVEQFMGTRDTGGLHVLSEVYYRRFRDIWPLDIDNAFDRGWLDPPLHTPTPDAT